MITSLEICIARWTMNKAEQSKASELADWWEEFEKLYHIKYPSINIRKKANETVTELRRLKELSGERLGLMGVLAGKLTTAEARVEDLEEALWKIRRLTQQPSCLNRIVDVAIEATKNCNEPVALVQSNEPTDG